nr:polysaccharide deacetylase family protein [uncultured Dorea sp.]
MSRRKLKSRMRRRRRRQCNILVGAICIAVIIIAVAICGRAMKKDAKQTASTSTIKEEKKSAKSKNLTINSNKSGKAKGKKVADRSDFAVQPGRKVGTTEQSDEKIVYLTLDDGPSQNTQKVLDILDKYNAKATFFVTGAMPEYKDMIKKAYDKGHTIGMHTYSHDYAKVYASVDSYFQDLDQIGQLVKEEIGYVPCFIRFPGGSSNTISANYTKGIMTTLTQEVQARGYQYYDWNGSSGDGAVRTTDQLVTQATSFHDNNIILLSHDSETKDTTVEALPKIIEYYQSKGYVFKALNLNSYVAHHGVNN